MTVMLICLYVLSFLELLAWTGPLWRWRRISACALIVSLSIVSGLLFGGHFDLWAGIVTIFSAYRVVNLLRILENRLQPQYMHRVVRRTSWWLIGSQLIAIAIFGLIQQSSLTTLALWYVAAGGQLLGAVVLFASTWRHLGTTRPDRILKRRPDQKLPTLSVLIPARNETDDLQRCLESLVTSNYPKLEIIVLDDCSQNKRTPGIIRDFAQSGVRFIAGEVPPKQWLAKNYAYHRLSTEANGELLLFCGVDTRFEPDSLRSMVELMLNKHKTVMSFIPRNTAPAAMSLESMMVQPARYAWELSPPRRLFHRPPVLSTCWLASAKTLRSAGGFEAVSRSIAPESYFARYAARHSDGYSFLRSDSATDVASAKSLEEQRATAVRTRYPQLHRKPELVAWSVIGELYLLTLPFAILLAALMQHHWLLVAVSASACLLLTAFYAMVTALTYRRFLIRGLWTLPFVAIYDLGLLNYSMWQYEFREVVWKGRNVCIPVMQTDAPVTPHRSK